MNPQTYQPYSSTDTAPKRRWLTIKINQRRSIPGAGVRKAPAADSQVPLHRLQMSQPQRHPARWSAESGNLQLMPVTSPGLFARQVFPEYDPIAGFDLQRVDNGDELVTSRTCWGVADWPDVAATGTPPVSGRRLAQVAAGAGTLPGSSGQQDE